MIDWVIFQKNKDFYYRLKKRPGSILSNVADQFPHSMILAIHHIIGFVSFAINFCMFFLLDFFLLYLNFKLFFIEDASCFMELIQIIQICGLMVPLLNLALNLLTYYVFFLGLVYFQAPTLKKYSYSLLLYYDYHFNTNLQDIGTWLLLAGGVTVAFGAMIQTFDFANQVFEIAFLQVCLSIFLIYARIWVYCSSILNFLHDIENSNASSFFINLVRFGALLFFLFNLFFVYLVGSRAVLYIRKLFPGGENVNIDFKIELSQSKENKKG